jgi:hypothetical protein
VNEILGNFSDERAFNLEAKEMEGELAISHL